MKIVFAGTPEFAAQAMRAIDAAGHRIVLALTQPDRRAGRGMHFQASPVKTFALEKNIPVLQPASLRRNGVDPEKNKQALTAYQRLSEIDFDVMVVVAYGLILPQEILDIAECDQRHGCFNIHASILPRWRGAAPIQRAIEQGDSSTGVSIMKMDAGLDTGDTVLVHEINITRDETSASLHDRLSKLGADSIVEVLNIISQGAALVRTPQTSEGVRYAEKILKSEADINWQLSATVIDCRIRAFNPFPGATSNLDGIPMKFWNSRIPSSGDYSQSDQVGAVLGFSKKGVFIQCGQGVIEVLEMQRPGGKRLNAAACLQTHGVPPQALRFYRE